MVESKYFERAETLIEALPYIKKFQGGIIVIKYGGSAMGDKNLRKKVLEDIILLKLVGFKPIIVHGGGKEINSWLEKVNIEPRFEEGLRVTDEKTLEVAEMVLAKINKELVSLSQSLGISAVGVCGKDAQLLKVKKETVKGKDIGFVGAVKDVNNNILKVLLEEEYLPIIYPIGLDKEGQGYNVNADEVARAVAESLKAEKLIFLTDTEGVYKNYDEDISVTPELYAHEARALMKKDAFSGGMLPKIKSCLKALKSGVKRIHILDGRIPHSLLVEIFTDKGAGTAILSSHEEKNTSY